MKKEANGAGREKERREGIKEEEGGRGEEERKKKKKKKNRKVGSQELGGEKGKRSE